MVVDLPRCGPMLIPRVPHLVPIPGITGSAHCGQAARRTSRSSCCATNSLCCAGKSTDPRSPTPTAACSQRLRPRSRDRAEPGGWSPPTRCCVGTGAASSGTGPDHIDRRADRRPQRRFADSHCASQLRIRLGDTAASTANSPGSATRTLDRHPAAPRPHRHLEPSPTREARRRLHRSLQHASATRCPFDSSERPAAMASSTNTNMPPDQPRHHFVHPQGPNLGDSPSPPAGRVPSTCSVPPVVLRRWGLGSHWGWQPVGAAHERS